jgi:glucose uptake protein GlcU
MLSRLVLGFCFSLFMSALMAAPVTAIEDEEVSEDKKLAQTVFELERSVAILQLSKVSLEDYKVMNEKMTSLDNRADFFAVLTLLLCMALVALFIQVRNQKKRLELLELNSKT